MLLDNNSFYLVGIKGVAMTALAQCLLDAGKHVRGWDVAEDFVTAGLLNQRQLEIDIGETHQIPPDTDCVVYTAAHQGPANPLVQQAVSQGITCVSHAQALGELFNQAQGLAVSGVGGKSTTSAMLAWILHHAQVPASFAIGVGNIPGLDKTGYWNQDSQYFVAEADEYVVDPAAATRGEAIVPRFSFMQPWLTICTNLEYDHPDVYQNFAHTLSAYSQFFSQLKHNGILILNSKNRDLLPQLNLRSDLNVLWFGQEVGDIQVSETKSSFGKTTATIQVESQSYQLELQLPGIYNIFNAAAAILAAKQIDVSVEQSISALTSFRSTKRRAEFLGAVKGVRYYDDYAHHPSEIQQVIHAFKTWFPKSRLVIAFQAHTYSRTKSLFNEFASAFDQADEVAMVDIFASAREAYDPSITSDMLCQAINQKVGVEKARNHRTLSQLAAYLSETLKPGDVCVTVGAGDIYHLHDMVKA